MSTKMFDCCLQQDLMPTIVKRRQLLHTRCLPTQTDVREKHGKELADVIFDRMNPVEKCLMGVDEPLKGPPDQLWVDPRNQGKLVPISSYDHIRALTHHGILEIGGKLEERFQMHEQCKIDNAVREAVEFEQFEVNLRAKFQLKKERQRHGKELKMLELKLLEQQQDREDALKEAFENERKALIECLRREKDEKVKKIVTEAVQRTREQLKGVYEQRYCELLIERINALKEDLELDCDENDSVWISDAQNHIKKEVKWDSQSTNQKKMQSLDMRDKTKMMYPEQTTSNDGLELSSEVYRKSKKDDKLFKTECQLIKIGSLLNQLYQFCLEKSDKFCLVFEELQEELDILRTNLDQDSSDITADSSKDSLLKQTHSSDGLTSSFTWMSKSSSETNLLSLHVKDTLINDLTPQTLIKIIIKHVRRNPKYMKEALIKGIIWEKHSVKKKLEQIMSFFLNGQNLTECVNEIIESVPSDAEFLYGKSFDKSSIRCPKRRLIATKDSLDLIHLPHVPIIHPVNTSKLVEVHDSLDLFSHLSKNYSGTTVQTSSSDSMVEVEKVDGHLRSNIQKRHTSVCLDLKPNVPKYFKLNRRNHGLPYKECTDDDIDELFEEYRALHPNPLQKHLP